MNEYLKGSLGDALISLAITGVFLLVAGALHALFGSFGALPPLAAGFGLLWVCVLGAALVAAAITRLFRLNPHDTFLRFLGLHLLSTVPLMLGWSAFAAAWARAGTGQGVLFYAFGILSCFIALEIVTTLARGQVYRLVCFVIGLAGFVAFALFGR